jgi:hypothetical protein
MYIFVAVLLPLVGVCFADPGCNPAARVDCGEIMQFAVILSSGEIKVYRLSRKYQKIAHGY